MDLEFSSWRRSLAGDRNSDDDELALHRGMDSRPPAHAIHDAMMLFFFLGCMLASPPRETRDC